MISPWAIGIGITKTKRRDKAEKTLIIQIFFNCGPKERLNSTNQIISARARSSTFLAILQLQLQTHWIAPGQRVVLEKPLALRLQQLTANVWQLSPEDVHPTEDPAGTQWEVAIKAVGATREVIEGIATNEANPLWNLLSNAIKFTPPGGKVSIKTKRTDCCVEMQVVDTGRGVDSEFLPLIFDRFTQSDPISDGKQKGLGLGLSIVRQIVELHGGNINAYSAGSDQGATFTVQIPHKMSSETQANQRFQNKTKPAEGLF